MSAHENYHIYYIWDCVIAHVLWTLEHVLFYCCSCCCCYCMTALSLIIKPTCTACTCTVYTMETRQIMSWRAKAASWTSEFENFILETKTILKERKKRIANSESEVLKSKFVGRPKPFPGRVTLKKLQVEDTAAVNRSGLSEWVCCQVFVWIQWAN